VVVGWAKFDDRRAMHAKFRKVGFAARGLDEAAICQVTADRTDGHISRSTVEMLAAAHGEKKWTTLVDKLVQVGRWEVNGTGWYIHDYLEYNPSKAEWDAEIERKRLGGQRGGKAKAVADARARATAEALADESADVMTVPSRPVLLTSSSTLPVSEKPSEEDEIYRKEAERRLKATTSVINRPDLWLQACIVGLKNDGWQPTLPERPEHPSVPSFAEVDQRKACENCGGSGWVLEDDENIIARRCEKCR